MGIYRSVKLYPSNTEPRSDMLMIRWEAPLFFANTASFKSRIKKHIGRFLEKNEAEKWWDEKMALMGDAENYYDDDQSNRHLMANTDQMMGYAGTHVVNGIQTDDDEYVDDELVTMR